MSLTEALTAVGEIHAARVRLSTYIEHLNAVGGQETFVSSCAPQLGEIEFRLGNYVDAARWADVGRGLADSDDVDAQVRWRALTGKLEARDA